MKSTVGVYNTHNDALIAVEELNNANFPIKHLTIMGKLDTEVVDKHMRVSGENPLKYEGIEAGTALGITLGVLTGVGILAIPGLGFIYGAGALAGAIAGFDAGLIGGGLASVIETLVSRDNIAKKYKTDLAEGKFLLVVKGSHDEVELAKKILAEHGTHEGLESHANGN